MSAVALFNNMKRQTHYRVCNLCEAMCGIKVDVDPDAVDGSGITIRPDPNDPFSKGSMCPKAPALESLHLDESRLRHPVKRDDENWVEISWEEAYDTIDKKIAAVRSKYGNNAIAAYLGNPIVHNLGMLLFVKTLTASLRTKNVYSATSMDQLPHHFAAHFMFGHEFRIPVPDLDRTDYMIILGANPLASNGSIMTSAGVTERLKSIRERGGKFVVIDPRKTETAKVASEHHFINPATDVYFLLAFLHVLYRDKHVDLGRLKEHIRGEELLEGLVAGFSPIEVERITGIEAAEIERLVLEFTASDKAVIYGRMGLSTQPHGGLNNWLLNTINIVSGNFDRAGGMMFPSPALEMARESVQPKKFGRWKSKARGLKEFYGELPVSGMADEFTADDSDNVKAFMTICGNPVLSTPNGTKLEKSLPNIEFMFSIDNYINETTRHANIILPTPSGLEIDHYDLIFHVISVSNNVKFSEALFPVGKDRPYDWQVLKELSKRFSQKRLDLFTRFATPRRVVNWGLMLGPYGKLSHPKRWFSGLSLAKVIKSKHGIRLGPMVPRVPEGLITDDKKIHLSPDVFVQRLKEVIETDFPELKRSHEAQLEDQRAENTLRLIGRRHVNTNNSWMHQIKKLSRSNMVRCTAMINSEDAVRMKISDGAQISVTSAVGQIELPAEVTDDVISGTICIPHGFGHNRPGTRVPIASEKPGVSVNDITDNSIIDPVTGNAAFSGQLVTIKALSEMQAVANVSGKPLTVLYGSRTGNAESVSRQLAQAAEAHDQVADVFAMDEFDANALPNTERLLIVCSTYGEGDMPDNAQSLWDHVNSDNKLDLSGVAYSVLALGDTAYETFCQAGKAWDARLTELGAKRVSDRIDCSVDYTVSAKQWMDQVLPLIGLQGNQDEKITRPSRVLQTQVAGNSREHPLEFIITEKRSLTASDSSKETYHYQLEAEGIEELYESGGILNVFPKNDPLLVQALVDELSLPAHYPERGALLKKFEQEFDLRMPSVDLINMLGDKAIELEGLDVLDLVKMIPKESRDVKRLIKCLRPLMPRSYSIASSPTSSPGSVDLCVATVRYKIAAREYGGAASTYLQDRVAVGDIVCGYFVANKSFTLPEDKSQPLIMIGPGTGLAPFRGFLQDHKIRGYTSPTWLFFGERNETVDYLYKDDIEHFKAEGTLTRLDTAFSRDQAEKIYVQHRMLDQGAELYRWLEDDAVVFVCGDAKAMAHDVHVALLDIIKTHGSMTENEALAYVEAMKQNRRYLKDVY